MTTPFYQEKSRRPQSQEPSPSLLQAPAHPLFGKCCLWEARRNCNLEITPAGVRARLLGQQADN